MQPNPDFDYRSLLRTSLAARCSLNPRYSLRAFARDLGISPGQLSSLMAGKRGISIKMANAILDRLNLAPDEKRLFLLHFQQDFGRSKTGRDRAKEELREHRISAPSRRLDLDQFERISDWHHWAILQLIGLKKARRKESEFAGWAAKRLGIQTVVATDAVDRLLRLELLRVEDGMYLPTEDMVLSTNGVPSQAIRNFHKRILHKAEMAIELQPIHERYFTTVMIPLKNSAISRVNEEILKFQKRIVAKYDRTSERDGDALYTLAQQFFRLTTSNEN